MADDDPFAHMSKLHDIVDDMLKLHDRLKEYLYKGINSLIIAHAGALVACLSFLKDAKDKLPQMPNEMSLFAFGLLAAIFAQLFMVMDHMHTTGEMLAFLQGKQNKPKRALVYDCMLGCASISLMILMYAVADIAFKNVRP